MEALSKLSFGFSTLTQYPGSIGTDNPVDGRVERQSVNETWATIIAGAGTAYEYTSSSMSLISMISTSTNNQWQNLARQIVLFDTSALTAGATISAGVLSLYDGGDKYDNGNYAPDVDIYTSTPASNISLQNSDYSQVGSTSQTGSPITWANWTDNSYNDFTFNATGRGNISKTSISKFGIRNANYDVAASAPTWVSAKIAYISVFTSNRAGTANDPKLVVTYTVPVTDTSNFFQLF